MTEFQPADNAAVFKGEVSAINILSPGPLPTTVISRNTPYTIQVLWKTSGFMAGGLGGNWEVRAFLESMGDGFEGQVGTAQTVGLATGVLNPATGEYTYQASIAAPAANTVLNQDAGLYKLVVTIIQLNPGPTGTAGYDDGKMLQFIN